MVTENTELGDELTQDQQTLDQEQGITPDGSVGAVPTMTVQQLADRVQALETANQQLASQNRGLQGKVDTGLNAIRRDEEANRKQAIQQLKQEMANQAWLDSLDEDQRDLAKGILERTAQAQTPVAPEPQPQLDQQAANAQLVQAWGPVVQFAEQMGLQRSDPRIQWTLMADVNQQPDNTKLEAFRDHIITLRSQDLGASPAPTAGAPQTPAASVRQQTASPPVEGATQISGGGVAETADNLRDALLEGRLGDGTPGSDREEFVRRMRAIGESA